MRAYISTSKLIVFAGLAALLLSSAGPSLAHAEEEKEKTEDRTGTPEEDDFSNTPFTEYGEFNEQDDEEAETKFFQYGRFFGVSLAAGYQGVTGNRGIVWKGGLPAIDFKVHCWFDFNTAIQLGLT